MFMWWIRRRKPEQACFLPPSFNKAQVKYTKIISSNTFHRRLITVHAMTDTYQHKPRPSPLFFFLNFESKDKYLRTLKLNHVCSVKYIYSCPALMSNYPVAPNKAVCCHSASFFFYFCGWLSGHSVLHINIPLTIKSTWHITCMCV